MSEQASSPVDTEVVTANSAKDETKDLVPEFYSQHGGDPRTLDISFCVMLNRLPTDFLADTYEQFTDCIKNMLQEEHKLDPATIKKVGIGRFLGLMDLFI
uniref:Uncharacterized protein n=1 Tax=Caenorhabditis japonica TaxID=281687 RepID=A0A8R1INZ4_CAEJA